MGVTKIYLMCLLLVSHDVPDKQHKRTCNGYQAQPCQDKYCVADAERLRGKLPVNSDECGFYVALQPHYTSQNSTRHMHSRTWEWLAKG